VVDLGEIIIKSFNGIGDLLFLTPTLRVIKKAYSNLKIIVNTNYPQVLENNPFVSEINTREKEGLFLGYDDPIHAKYPTTHHILKDWEIITKAFNLITEKPQLKPEIHFKYSLSRINKIGVQVLHKNQWYGKKNWDKFHILTKLDGFISIPKLSSIKQIVEFLVSCKAVVCSEGGISHLCRALDIPCIVIYGGWANPEWNGYGEQINICNEKFCSYCYDPRPCRHPKVEKLCMREITVEQVVRATEGVFKHKDMETHDQLQYIKREAALWCKGKGIDVGAGRNCFPGARPIDNNINENAYKINESDNSLDYIFSSHCLEHLQEPIVALKEWHRALKHRGVLFLYLPHNDYIPWRPDRLPEHKFAPKSEEIVKMLTDIGFKILEVTNRDHWFGFRIVGEKL